jgi:hypothetical protein
VTGLLRRAEKARDSSGVEDDMGWKMTGWAKPNSSDRVRSRGRRGLLGVAGAALLLFTGTAHALPLVQLRIDGGDPPVAIEAGQPFTVEIRLVSGPRGISSYGVSFLFDGEGLDAFDVVSVDELLPPGFGANLTSGVEAVEESQLGVPGRVKTCEAVTFGAGPVGVGFAACRVQLVSTGATGTFTIEAGLFNLGIDGVFDNEGVDSSASLQTATAVVNVVPEPGAALLVAIGLLGLRLRRAAA